MNDVRVQEMITGSVHVCFLTAVFVWLLCRGLYGKERESLKETTITPGEEKGQMSTRQVLSQTPGT